MIVARDAGPGIADVDRALEVGYTTYGGRGLGLPGSRRLMDEFAISSSRARHHRHDDEVAPLKKTTVATRPRSGE
jgi:anti-sigma regulatory factor (Ser/Thr protein kinase)